MLDGARIFHININCSHLARSRTFYVDGCGLTEGVRTAPEHPQPGDAFGFDRAWWDALILIGANGFDGGAIDLLQWLEPKPTGAPPADLHEPGFQRIGIEVPDVDTAMASGPTSTRIRSPAAQGPSTPARFMAPINWSSTVWAARRRASSRSAVRFSVLKNRSAAMFAVSPR